MRPRVNVISRGLGRSYGDAALNRDNAVVLHERLDRFLAFDPATGVLRMRGGRFARRILRCSSRAASSCPSRPAPGIVTVGGAIAADVHGKNHHRDGSIADFVRRLRAADRCGDDADLFPRAERRRLLGDHRRAWA